MTADWAARWRSHFPLCESRAYFFAGAQAPLATEVKQAIDDFLELWDEKAWRFEPAGFDLLEASASLLGELLACDPGRVAPADSTSHAMGLATGMVLARWIRDGRPRANVVLQHDSHPASTYRGSMPSVSAHPSNCAGHPRKMARTRAMPSLLPSMARPWPSWRRT